MITLEETIHKINEYLTEAKELDEEWVNRFTYPKTKENTEYVRKLKKKLLDNGINPHSQQFQKWYQEVFDEYLKKNNTNIGVLVFPPKEEILKLQADIIDEVVKRHGKN